jgi:hypothetical protein
MNTSTAFAYTVRLLFKLYLPIYQVSTPTSKFQPRRKEDPKKVALYITEQPPFLVPIWLV